MKYRLIALFSLASFPAFAQQGLPPEVAVQSALDAHPMVDAAKARIEVAKADGRALRAGPHEVTVSGSYIRRSVVREGDYDEFDTTFSRSFRLPGKASLDRRAGEFGVSAAENLFADARHQAALLLAELWWDWHAAAGEAAIDNQSVQILEQHLAAIRRRVELRDAAQLDADMAEAALGTARLALAQSQGRVDVARARLSAQFPSLPLSADMPELPLPEIPVKGFAALRELVISRSHEIEAAFAESNRLVTLAERARRDRLGDPSIGLRIFSERNGSERGAGLVLSMPLGGRYRAAQSDKSAGLANVGLAELAAVRFSVQATADSDFARADASWVAWKRSREGLVAQVAAIQKMRRGHDLGGIDLGDMLAAERLARDAFRAEATSRSEALRAITRLRIDSHELWIGEDGHE